MIACANALHLPLADQSVHCVVTSPPYWNLRDYGTATWEGGDAGCDHAIPDVGANATSGLNAKRNPDGTLAADRKSQTSSQQQYRDTCPKCNARRIDAQLGLEPTPDAYVASMVKVFREVWRVLRDDGTCWLNLGDSYAGKAGGNAGVPEEWQRAGRGLTAASKCDVPPGLKPKDLCGIPWRVAFALQGFAVMPIDHIAALCRAIDSRDLPALDLFRVGFRLWEELAGMGWYFNRSDIIWAKLNPMPESCTDRPTKAHEYVFLLSKRAKYFYDAEAVKEGATTKPHAPGNLKLDASRNDHDQMQKVWGADGTRNRRTVWHIATQPYKAAHFATFPEKLVEPCVLAGTSEVGCCPACGAPWARAVEKTRVKTRPGENTKVKVPGGWDIDEGAHGTIHREGRTEATYRDASEIGNRDSGRHVTDTTTIAWAKPCRCDYARPVPCTVLDPFGGSGTTVLVAEKHGRRGIAFDLLPDYCRMARDRVGAAASPATWRTDHMNDSPLFTGTKP